MNTADLILALGRAGPLAETIRRPVLITGNAGYSWPPTKVELRTVKVDDELLFEYDLEPGQTYIAIDIAD